MINVQSSGNSVFVTLNEAAKMLNVTVYKDFFMKNFHHCSMGFKFGEYDGKKNNVRFV